MTQQNFSRVSPARQAAFDVLSAVAEGQYASDTLRARTSQLSSRDAGLAAQIVFGTLRYQAQLDHLIFLYSGRTAASLDGQLALLLRTAIFQLRYLQRIPPHAAVHETVELVKRVKRAAAGLTNAVLRKVNRDPVAWPDRATELSCPEWLLTRWAEHFGAPSAEAIARAFLQEPARYVRVRAGTAPPAGFALTETSVPGCFQIEQASERAADAQTAPLRLHDIGSQAVLAALDLQPGHTYLDLCAAPGNKTVQALETPLKFAVACDISYPRLQTMEPVCPRVVLNGTDALPFSRCFDRIFIDAPCSGTGTIGRNPEIKWRVQRSELASFAKRQVELVKRALPLLAPGGKLLYATCSLEREENEEVVHAVMTQPPVLPGSSRMRFLNESWRLPGRDPGDGFYGAVFAI